VLCNNLPADGFVDCGSTCSMITEKLAKQLQLKVRRSNVVILSVSGERIPQVGETECDLVIGERTVPNMTVLVVAHNLPGNVSLLIGMDALSRVGGMTLNVDYNGRVSADFRSSLVASAVNVRQEPIVVLNDADFSATFNGRNWEVEWKWRNGPPELKNRVAQYAVPTEIRDSYNDELARWVQEGWLVPCDQPKNGGIIPLLAVHQKSKNKVRPVLDFRELNSAVQSHTADSEVCPETLRRWRLMGDKLGIVDLKNAYLQLHVCRDLQDFQIVRVDNQYYRLTRLGFGLTSAPKIMTAIVRHILASDPVISKATDHFVDDIVIDTALVSVDRVVEHLRMHGLETKPPETLDSARVLGLQLRQNNHGKMTWTRSKNVPTLPDKPLTRRELFSICGCLVGHYPVAGWLRVACSFIKRHAEGKKWNDRVGSQVMAWLQQVLSRLAQSDPVQGLWAVPPRGDCRVWCDASSLATGVALQIGDDIVEDAAWLRKKHDAAHINVAELESVIQGINMAIRWEMKTINVMTDSATVCGWMSSVLTRSHRVKSHGLAEMLIKRRLSMIAELVQTYDLTLTVELVPSASNKADILTRVPQAWLRDIKHSETQVCATARFSLEKQHQQHHFGVERTLQLARQVDETVSRNAVEHVVKECETCSSIDPAPVRWSKGHLQVNNCWDRIAVDITHFDRDQYLTCIDCGPSRYTIWRKINTESSAVVAAALESIFIELGPPAEILLDNSATFRSDFLRQLCHKWSVRLRFRCAYRASGNGIVERVHRTIKRIAARASISPQEATFWYNLAPLNRSPTSSPSSVLFNSDYRWRNPCIKISDTDPVPDSERRFNVGELVFIKPPMPRCTTQWSTGRVTAVLSEHSIEVDGIPRHIADCRLKRTDDPDPNRNVNFRFSAEDDSESVTGGAEAAGDDEDESSSDGEGAQDPWAGRLRQHVLPPDRYMFS
jgi:hypothetical protein